MKRWEEFAQTAFDSMKAGLYRWTPDASSSTIRSLTRLLYDQVFCCGEPNKTGYISLNAMENKKNKQRVCVDHCLLRGWLGRKRPAPFIPPNGSGRNAKSRSAARSYR